jgi:hypothetical protein
VTEPRIQYAKTEDGVSIAYYTLGEGEPCVSLPIIPATGIDASQSPELRWLGQRRTRSAGAQGTIRTV